jgi:outer membrane protein insertion porin family
MMRYVWGCMTLVCLSLAAGVEPAHGNNDPDRWTVESVSFSGNEAFGAAELKKVMVTQPSAFLVSRPFYPGILEGDLKGIRLFYNRQGYLDADIVGHEVVRDSSSGKVAISIDILEGPLTRVEDVTVFGNKVFPDSVLLERFGTRPGDPLRRKTIDDGVTAVMTMYANRGYLEGTVSPDIRVNTETNMAIVDFLIEEGDQYRIGEIRIETLLKTRPKVVRRELLFEPGQVVTYRDLLRSQRRLYMTGLFSGVFIRPRDPAAGDSAVKDIVVEIKEKESIELAFGIGYGAVERARGSLEIADYNIRGTALKAGLAGEASLIRRRVEASFTDPWIFSLPVRGDLSVRYQYLDEPGYRLERKAGSVSLGRKFGEWARASLSWSYVDDNLLRVEVEEVPEELKSNLRTLTLSLVYDTRDDISNATRGVYADWTNDLAGVFLGGTDSFTRSTLGLRVFHRLTSHTTMASALEIGWMKGRDTSREIPLGERFYAGGPNSLRGFGYQLVGPLDGRRKPLGGLFKSVINVVEIRQDIYKMLGAAVFMDVGNVWPDVEAFRLEDYRSSAGFGLRLNTPIGIIRGDLGFNLAPYEGESRTVFHFNVGQAF